jgi:hypothetical protein
MPCYELTAPEANQILDQAARDEFLVKYHGSWTGTRAPQQEKTARVEKMVARAWFSSTDMKRAIRVK